jgi:anti-sigma B factor antagonist
MIDRDRAAQPGPLPGDSADGTTLAVTVHQQGEAVVLEVCGEVDVLTGPRLHESVMTLLEDHPPVVVIDLAAVTFFGSSGLAVLAEAQRAAEPRTRLRVVAVGATTLRPLQVTGLDQQLAVYPTREDAVGSA